MNEYFILVSENHELHLAEAHPKFFDTLSECEKHVHELADKNKNINVLVIKCHLTDKIQHIYSRKLDGSQGLVRL